MSKVYEALRKAERERRNQPTYGVGSTEDLKPVLLTDSTAVERTTEQPTETSLCKPTYLSSEKELGPLELSGSRSRVRNHRLADFISGLRDWTRRFQSSLSDQYVLNGKENGKSWGREQFHVLRTYLEDWTAEHQKYVLMVTSALRGEGKSFVAVNLAITLASKDTPVLLIDADLRQPKLHRIFNLVPLGGLAQFLVGNSDFNRCLHQTSVEGLTLIPAGGINLSAAEAFASSRMKEFIQNLRNLGTRPHIIIDVPAVLTVPEAQILARLVDGVVLVVRAGVTPRNSIAKALEALKETTIVTTVLNRFEPPFSMARQLKYGDAAREPSAGDEMVD